MLFLAHIEEPHQQGVWVNSRHPGALGFGLSGPVSLFLRLCVHSFSEAECLLKTSALAPEGWRQPSRAVPASSSTQQSPGVLVIPTPLPWASPALVPFLRWQDLKQGPLGLSRKSVRGGVTRLTGEVRICS